MKKSLIVLFTIAFLAVAQAVVAAPTYYLQGKGTTTFDATDLAQAASSAGLQLNVLSGTPSDGAFTYTFTIVGGAIDAGSLLFEAVHVGGFTVTDGTNTVTFNSPIINTVPTQPILTMLVTINGDLQGRFTVGNVQAPALDKTVTNGTKVKVKGLAVTLPAFSVSVLNQVFATSAFSVGQPMATAKSKLFAGNQLP